DGLRVGEFLRPALHLLVDGLRAVEQRLVRREVLVEVAIRAVARADLQRLEPGEDVELRQEELGQAVQSRGVAEDHRVEPSALPTATGDGSELMPALAESF